MPERLTVVKRAGCYFVAYDEAGEDWVACFILDGAFPAENWAKRMAFLYNTLVDDSMGADTVDSAGLEPGT